MQSSLKRNHRILERLVAELVQGSIELDFVCLRILQNFKQLGAQIAFEKRTEFWIDTLLELRFELCRAQVFLFEISGNELRQHQATIEEARESVAGVGRQPGPGSPFAGRTFLERTGCHRRSLPSLESEPGCQRRQRDRS